MPSWILPFQVVLAPLGVVAVARAGATTARLLRQPQVVGEVAAGLLLGPLLVRLLGRHGFDSLLPGPVLRTLALLSQAAVVLFLLHLVYELRTGPRRPSLRSIRSVAAGSLLAPALCGLLLYGWIDGNAGSQVRGTAPTVSLLLFLAAACSVTAVPVLARIMVERGLMASSAGRAALAAAVATDAAAWVVLVLVVSLGDGGTGRLPVSLAALVLAWLAAQALRRVLARPAVTGLVARSARPAAVLLAAASLLLAEAAMRLGLSAVLAAAMLGLALPARGADPWAGVLRLVGRVASVLVPVFFASTGISLFVDGVTRTTWVLCVLVLVLGAGGKLLGGYLGGRLAGYRSADSWRIAALLNTRGLTELVFLQAGYDAGIVSDPLYLALVVMALVSTVATGPALWLIDRRATAGGTVLPEPVPADAT